MRYYFIAGERSGDLHTGNLAKAILKYDSEATMRGFGGEYMRGAGIDVAVDYNEMAVMGFWEVLMNLNKISRYIKRCKEDILQFKPDVVILIDYGGFNKRIAAFAKQKNIRTFYYISPKVWAWNQNRAWKLKAIVDRMFVILPFEKEFYKKFNWDVDYVGNPVLDAVKAHSPAVDFKVRHNIDPTLPLVALLPGSRKQELLNIIALMADVAKRFPEYRFAVAVVNNLDTQLYQPLRELSNVTFVTEDAYNLLQNSAAAIVTSGTATLETALFRVPQIVVYKTSAVTYRIVKMIIRVPFISLVNLIAGREVVRELIQNDLTVENVAEELEAILTGPKREAVMQGYDEIIQILDTGSASDNAGRLMVGYLKNG
ncbi:MAG TPA: lipid-A-disaccharide synthase [Ohtaekwangia sp.]|nr:lipid-A-disaccharide synthase [Ohtaekwangia sp.]